MEAVWAWMGQPYSAAGCDPAGLVPAARAGGSSSADRFGGVLLPRPGRRRRRGGRWRGHAVGGVEQDLLERAGPRLQRHHRRHVPAVHPGLPLRHGLAPRCDANLLNLYAAGRLKLDELITRRYALDDVNQAYADMRPGVNIRGVVDFIPAG
jgi:hypothetical protein